MRRVVIGTLAVALTCGLAPLNAFAAETLLSAKMIRTVDERVPTAQAMVYDDNGKILAVGDTAALSSKYPNAKRLDVGDATVIPGLIDAHGHLLSLGNTHLRPNLSGTTSKAQIIEQLQAFVTKMDLPKGAWLVGR